MTLCHDIIEVCEEAHKCTGKEYTNLVPLALTFQEYDIDTLKQLQGIIKKHDEMLEHLTDKEPLYARVKRWIDDAC